MTDRKLDIDDSARHAVIQSLVKQAHGRLDPAALTLLTSVLTPTDTNNSAISIIIKALLDYTNGAQLEQGIAAVRSYPWLVDKVLEAALCQPSDQQRGETASQNGIDPGAHQPESQEPEQVRMMRLATQLLSEHTSEDIALSLMDSCLTCMLKSEDQVADAAKSLTFALLDILLPTSTLRESLFDTILSLLEHESNSKSTLAYALWLRALLSFPSSNIVELFTRQGYFDKIANGLVHGDSERRKMSIEILRQTVAIALQQDRPDLITDITAERQAIIDQYARFLTVYETFVLARYSNLVAETRHSLQLLISTDSVLPVRWQQVLLQIALQSGTQDQVRRFVGKWIMDGSLAFSYGTDDFHELFSSIIIDWLAEGHLYTASISLSSDGTYRCAHGERVAHFLQQVMISQPTAEAYSNIIDGMLAFLQARTDIFAFTVVYILAGWLDAQLNTNDYALSMIQIQAVIRISEWTRLPYAAKRFITYACWRLVKASTAITGDGVTPQLGVSGLARWKVLGATFGQNSTADAMSGPNLSVRDRKIQEALDKCTSFPAVVKCSSSSEILTVLEDIWTDAEYLEYPRELMIALPRVYLDTALIRLLANDQDANSKLKDMIGSVIAHLLSHIPTRSYMLTPFMTELRRTVLLVKHAIDVLDLESVILEIANAPPEPKLDLRFEYATLKLLHDLQTHDSTSGEVWDYACESDGFAAYIDMINRLEPHQNLLMSLIKAIISRWLRQKIPPPTVSAFKSSLQLQVLLLCIEQIHSFDAYSAVDLIKDLFKLLSIEPLPRYRFILSWMLVRLLARFPEHQAVLLDLLSTQDHHANPKYVAALMKLSIDLLQTDDIGLAFTEHLAHNFVALSSSSKIVIRHEAQWSFPKMIDLARRRGWATIHENPAHQALDRYIRALPKYDDPPKDRKLAFLDIKNQHNITTLVEGHWTDLDYNRPPYARRHDLVKLLDRDRDRDIGLLPLPQSCLPLGDAIVRETMPQVEDSFAEPSILGPKQMTQDQAIALQTKGSAYLRVLLDDVTVTKPRTLLVIASLIDNAYNLGGLSRVSEIFGVQTLYVRDPRIIAEKDFTSVAVSSHNHIDIMPLTTDDIPKFLAAKRKDGWTVVGVEQTDRSVMLGQQSSLPEKSILIIGNEKLGMPGNIIKECDVLVEIPQKGVTRSMNVQTVAAVVLYEYNRLYSE